MRRTPFTPISGESIKIKSKKRIKRKIATEDTENTEKRIVPKRTWLTPNFSVFSASSVANLSYFVAIPRDI
jgi:hypothetical protein